MRPTLVVLAGGKGTRFLPLTETTPKPLLPILGKPALEHNLEKIAQKFSEIIIGIGYLGEKIQAYFGNSYKDVPIKYFTFPRLEGTGSAVFDLKELVTSPEFVLMYGDDLYDRVLVEKLLTAETSATIGQKVLNWQQFGVFQIDKSGNLEKIVEKPTKFVGDLVNIGLYKVSSEIFSYFAKIRKSVRDEYEFTDMLTLFAKDHPVKVIETTKGWNALSYPWDLLTVNESKLKDLKTNIQGVVEKGATIKGQVSLGEGSIIKSGAYLEGNFVIGKNCVIGPNCYLKGFAVIGDGSVVGNAVEITRSVIGNNSNIRHLVYLGDSLVGNNVNLSAGFIASNFKHTQTNIQVMISGKLVDSGRNKLGAIIGDGVKTGVHTCVYPGRKIYSEVWTLPGEIISEDKKKLKDPD